MLKYVLPLIFFPIFSLGQTAQEVFSSQVHPLLRDRCTSCHGVFQFPYHALEDPAESYPDARKVLNFNFPDQSRLWVRSYNNHCKDLSKCGTIVPELLEAIEAWSKKEKQEFKDEFVELAEVVVSVPQEINGEVEFSLKGPNNEEYGFQVTRLGETLIYFHRPTLKKLQTNLSFKGFELRSLDVQMQSQNFSDLSMVVRETQDKVKLTRFGSGYILALLPNPSMTEMKLKLAFNNWNNQMSYEQLKELFQDGYLAPMNQLIMTPKITSLSLGHGRHACAIFEPGNVKCWGNGFQGKLGSGSGFSIGEDVGQLAKMKSIEVGSEEKVLKVGIGSDHTCVLLDRGLKCWGYNYNGQLGYGHRLSKGFIKSHMGDNLPYIDLGTDLKVKNLAVGGRHNCVLFEDDSIKCWGYNSQGQLGYGDKNHRGDSADEMGENLPFVDLGYNKKIVKLVAGYDSTCALFEGGAIKCWGANKSGQLGSGDTNHRGDEVNEMGANLPFVDLGSEGKIVDITMGNSPCALFQNGKVKCWGDNSVGQAGVGSIKKYIGNSPGQMGENLKYANLAMDSMKISSGSRYNCALADDEKIKCWGYNSQGQLGLGDNISRGSKANQLGDNLPYISLGAHSGISSMSSGDDYSCLLFSNGAVKCWGRNNTGQLGLGSKIDKGDSLDEMGTNLPFLDFGQKVEF